MRLPDRPKLYLSQDESVTFHFESKSSLWHPTSPLLFCSLNHSALLLSESDTTIPGLPGARASSNLLGAPARPLAWHGLCFSSANSSSSQSTVVGQTFTASFLHQRESRVLHQDFWMPASAGMTTSDASPSVGPSTSEDLEKCQDVSQGGVSDFLLHHMICNDKMGWMLRAFLEGDRV